MKFKALIILLAIFIEPNIYAKHFAIKFFYKTNGSTLSKPYENAIPIVNVIPNVGLEYYTYFNDETKLLIESNLVYAIKSVIFGPAAFGYGFQFGLGIIKNIKKICFGLKGIYHFEKTDWEEEGTFFFDIHGESFQNVKATDKVNLFILSPFIGYDFSKRIGLRIDYGYNFELYKTREFERKINFDEDSKYNKFKMINRSIFALNFIINLI